MGSPWSCRLRIPQGGGPVWVKRTVAAAEEPDDVSENEDRQFERNPAKLEAKITSELGSCVRGTVQDVSVAGLFVACTERLPVGTMCELMIEVLSGEDAGPIEATGRVAHVEPDGMGLEITDLTLDGYDELRRLVGHEEPTDS